MAKYHEVCRFTDDGSYDQEAALFHLKAAADCGIMVATIALGEILFYARGIRDKINLNENSHS